MTTRCLLLLLVVSSVSLPAMQTSGRDASAAGSQAAPENTCPWLSVGSVAKALGGDVDVAATGSAEDGTCRFSRRDAAMDTLEIAVGGNAPPGCPAGSVKLVGIGNEAARCHLTAARGEMAEMVSGRVRDLNFTLILRGQKRDAKPQDPQSDALERLAEQVAGNLF